MRLTPLDGHLIQAANASAITARITADGAFKFANSLGTVAAPDAAGSVGDGIYQVGLSGLPANMYIATARYGTRDALDNGLHIEGNPNAPLKITIEVGGTVHGVVKKGNNTVSDSLVALIPPTGILAVLAYSKAGYVSWQTGLLLIPGVFLGGILGGKIAKQIPAGGMRKIFAALLFLLGISQVVGAFRG